jgi:hypothetical protein
MLARHSAPRSVQPCFHDERFRTVAEFEVALESAHAWLNRAMFFGVSERLPGAALVRFHEIL